MHLDESTGPTNDRQHDATYKCCILSLEVALPVENFLALCGSSYNVKKARSQSFVMTGYSAMAAHHRPCIGAGITEISQQEGEGNDDPQPRTNTKSSPLGHIMHANANVTLELSME
jgi:hypothetical protein